MAPESTAPPSRDVAALAFEDTQRALDRQAVRLSELHSRSMAVAGLAIALAGFLAEDAFEVSPYLGGGAVLLAALVAMLTVWVHIPATWRFSRNPGALLSFAGADEVVDSASYFWLSTWDLADDFDHNEAQLHRRACGFVLSIPVLAVETAFLLIPAL